MELPISNWMKLSDEKIQRIIRELKVYEVKEPDTGNVRIRDIIYFLEASREEIYRLVHEIESRDEQIKSLKDEIVQLCSN